MSTAMAIRCGCCRVTTDASLALFDGEIQAHVCPACRRELNWAKAQMGALAQIKDVYHGKDAPDNQVPLPPPSDL